MSSRFTARSSFSSTNGRTALPRWSPISHPRTDLATVVGEKTRGNVLGAMNFKVGSGYWLRLPVSGWFTSKGRSLEGNGVDPDVEISADGLAVGLDDQMTKAVQIVSGL